MSWFFLLLAGLLEVVWAYYLKKSDGFTNPVPTLITVVGMGLSFWFLSLSLKTLPFSIAYAVWTGIGIIGTAILGMTLLGEEVDYLKIFCICLILAGIFGLKIIY